MKATIYQPQYFPRLHYLNRILNADVFILLDAAQFTKTLVHISPEGRERHPSYQSVTPIKTNAGSSQLSVPVKHKGLLPINQTQIDYTQKWSTKHAAIIKLNYQKAKNFSDTYPNIESLLSKKYTSLAELNIAALVWAIYALLGITSATDDLSLPAVNKILQKNNDFRLKKIIRVQELDVPRPEGLQKGMEWTVAICQKVGATEYIYGGTAQQGYMDLDFYKKNGITPVMQNWKCRQYRQQFEKIAFLPNLSIIDLLLNTDRQNALKILS